MMQKMRDRMKKLVLCLALLAVGCNKEDRTPQQTKAYENGTTKPVVAIVPLIDSARHHLPWDLSHEITSLIHYRLTQKDTLYIVDQEKVQSMLKRVKDTHHPFDTDFAWMKKVFLDDEFVVFMELIHHEQADVPAREVTASEDLPKELTIQVRLRVIDLRPETPKIALQEIIRDAHFIPKEFTTTHFVQVEWGKDNYSISPIGMAHAHISKEISNRLEDYILLAMKKQQS
jgi:hypothetical protein